MTNLPKPNYTRSAFAIWCLTLAIVLFVRIFAPSDLGQNLDQSKTIAFTVDMVQNNHWVLPVDGLGELSHKPPMVNWLGAPIVALGFHSQLALKLPAVISGIFISVIVFFAARFLFRKLDHDSFDDADRSIAHHATPLAMLAAGVWIASPSAVKHIYFMRPDILFAALLCAGWLLSIILLADQQPKHPTRIALGIWLLAACAALTKGPLALLIVVYLLVHIWVLIPKGKRRAAITKTHWQWGIPILLILPGLWLFAAYRAEPEHVRDVLFAKELGGRLGGSDSGSFLGGILSAATRNPAFFFERFLPWCLPAALAIVFKPSSKIRSHPLAPASLWVLLVILATTLLSLQAGSYIMPAYPAAAILAVYAIYRIIASPKATRIKPAIYTIGALIILSASLITAREATMSRGAKNRTGEHLIDFAHKASDLIGTDQVRFVKMGDLPIASLMGTHQAGEIEIQEAHLWQISPTDLGALGEPTLVSEPIVTHDAVTGEPIESTIIIGLYKTE